MECSHHVTISRRTRTLLSLRTRCLPLLASGRKYRHDKSHHLRRKCIGMQQQYLGNNLLASNPPNQLGMCYLYTLWVVGYIVLFVEQGRVYICQKLKTAGTRLASTNPRPLHAKCPAETTTRNRRKGKVIEVVHNLGTAFSISSASTQHTQKAGTGKSCLPVYLLHQQNTHHSSGSSPFTPIIS